MTAVQTVFIVTATAVAVSIGLSVAGVALLAGAGWALVAAGAMLGAAAVGTCAALLREGKP